jgi:hypothetical protein
MGTMFPPRALLRISCTSSAGFEQKVTPNIFVRGGGNSSVSTVIIHNLNEHCGCLWRKSITKGVRNSRYRASVFLDLRLMGLILRRPALFFNGLFRSIWLPSVYFLAELQVLGESDCNRVLLDRGDPKNSPRVFLQR